MMLANRMFPMATFDELRREMDRVLNSFARSGNGRSFGMGTYPPVNVWEDGQAFYVEAEIPGVDIKDVELQVVGNELTIRGKREACCGEDATFHRRERATGEFGRTVTLPTEVNSDKVEAVLKDGVLTVTLPKAEEARAKKISVKAE